MGEASAPKLVHTSSKGMTIAVYFCVTVEIGFSFLFYPDLLDKSKALFPPSQGRVGEGGLQSTQLPKERPQQWAPNRSSPKGP